jgi:hypothetical protein
MSVSPEAVSWLTVDQLTELPLPLVLLGELLPQPAASIAVLAAAATAMIALLVRTVIPLGPVGTRGQDASIVAGKGDWSPPFK